jgi:hypothetical protein
MVSSGPHAQAAEIARAQIAKAVRAGTYLDEIERTLIEPVPVGEDEKAALWLYAQVLTEWPGIRREPMSVTS